jgi:hypothetical protein
MNSDMDIAAYFYPVPDWEVTIHVERLSDKDDYSYDNGRYSVIIGVSEQDYTNAAPPSPLKYPCDMIIFDELLSEMKKDIRKNSHHEYKWDIAVDPHGNIETPLFPKSSVMTWNPLNFSSEGKYFLKSNIDETSEVVVPDMRLIHEYTVTGKSHMLFSIIWKKFKTFEFHLQKGWNLISLPITPEDTDLTQLFPDYEAAFGYKNGAYYQVTNIIPGTGYWLKVPAQNIYSISGQPYPSYTIDLSDGWHLIGGAFDEMTPEADSSISVIYRYVNGGYEQAFILMPGFGYWVKILE